MNTSEYTRFTAKYHDAGEDGWWSEIAGWTFSASAPTLDELRKLTREMIRSGIDERWSEPRSHFFIHFHRTPHAVINPDAQETFVYD